MKYYRQKKAGWVAGASASGAFVICQKGMNKVEIKEEVVFGGS